MISGTYENFGLSSDWVTFQNKKARVVASLMAKPGIQDFHSGILEDTSVLSGESQEI
jgi:hypothetical protein